MIYIPSNNRIPTKGYNLNLWGISGYKATAIAYMEREKLDEVTHNNGDVYYLHELKNSLVN